MKMEGRNFQPATKADIADLRDLVNKKADLVKVELEAKIEESKRETKDYVNEVVNKVVGKAVNQIVKHIDGLAGGYKKVDEGQEIIAHRQSEHSEALEDHEKRITLLETS